MTAAEPVTRRDLPRTPGPVPRRARRSGPGAGGVRPGRLPGPVDRHPAGAVLVVAAGPGRVLAVAIGRLFTIGHDACCHGRLPRMGLGQCPARTKSRFSLLYALQHLGTGPQHAAPRLHQRARQRLRVGPLQQAGVQPGCRAEEARLERIYRLPLGPGLYYTVEIWWKKLYFPRTGEVERSAWPTDLDPIVLVTAFLALQLALVSAWWLRGPDRTRRSSPWSRWRFPFAGWNLLMGFAIFQHHTHPQVAWFPTAPTGVPSIRKSKAPCTSSFRGRWTWC